MNVRRFVLRLAVGLLCFAAGWACVMLLGVAAPRRAESPRAVRFEIVMPHAELPHIAPPPPRFELEVPCGRQGMRHSHEWHDVPRLEDFQLDEARRMAEDFSKHHVMPRLEEFETMPMLPQLDAHLAPPPPLPPARPRRGVN